MEPHLHLGIEHWLSIGFIALLFRYFWKLAAATMAGAGGFFGQIGVAMGGIAQ